MKQRLFALVAALFLALLLFACGKTQGEDMPEISVQSTEPAETELPLEYPAVPEGPVVLWKDDPPAPLAVSPNGTVLTGRAGGLWSADFGKGGPTGWSSRLVGEEGAFRQVTDWESRILAISDHAGFAVDPEGRLWGFGANDINGQLGLGDTAGGQPVSAPEPVILLEQVEKIALGGDLYTMAVQSDGSLWLWGTYAYPEVSGRRIKEPLHVMKGVYKVSGTNGGAGLALARDGSLWALEQYSDAGTPSVSPVLLMEGIVALEGSLAIDASGWLWEFSQ